MKTFFFTRSFTFDKLLHFQKGEVVRSQKFPSKRPSRELLQKMFERIKEN